MAVSVRQPIDVGALEAYIGQHVPGIKVPLDVKQFGFGQSNPTYQLTSPDGSRYVLRKKPPGKLISQAAHKVEREHRIIEALGPTNVPVPKTYCLCADGSVVGTPFYIMGFLDGRILEDAGMPGMTAEERSSHWKAAVKTLAKFHRVDFRKVGLEDFGKHSDFYDRQVATWRHISAVGVFTSCCLKSVLINPAKSQEQVVDVKTGEPVGPIPHLDEMLAFFSDKRYQPKDRATLVHGDYKIDNMVFHPSRPEVIGLLDWEMATVGHPLLDLANMIHAFHLGPLQAKLGFLSDTFRPGTTPGLPTPDDIMDWYSEESGWYPNPDMAWAVAFAVFRASAISQGIAARVAGRQATSLVAKHYAEAFKPLGEYAWELVQKERDRVTRQARLSWFFKMADFPQFSQLAPELKLLIWDNAAKLQDYPYNILEQRNGSDIERIPSLRVIGAVHSSVSQVNLDANAARTLRVDYDTSILYLGFIFDEPWVLTDPNNDQLVLHDPEPSWYSISKSCLKKVKHVVIAWHSLSLMYSIHRLAQDLPNLETMVLDKTYFNSVDPFGETWEWDAYCNADDLKRTPARRARYVRAVFDQTPADDVNRACSEEVALENDVAREWEKPPTIRIITMGPRFWWQ
ncbi:Acyl-CoA dehydrogenase family member-like protein [Emericellopsis cladophorae]|uniref:Acyl-CoA dehydrogenase family member-like protein n=1 Tax=Emericellopsis cladophorae TaxID=2686198 RepID=A0A9P9XXA3_9HYPO|nr:Acyl-CoA dehydrogenase family member-like protein [Emericellopsis cladophorae]KAI6779268.1 Acyl-CoA dehydrogenase family member-like protein [Emericellopsis cladophorae]